jgi:hypothetical protein
MASPAVRRARGEVIAMKPGGVRHVIGPLWLVKGRSAGGYIVNYVDSTCTCPDRARRAQDASSNGWCKHVWAVSRTDKRIDAALVDLDLIATLKLVLDTTALDHEGFAAVNTVLDAVRDEQRRRSATP